MTIESRNKIITIVLGIAIIGLGWWLYRSIVDPYKVVEERERITQQVHRNMEQIRDGLVQYNRDNDKYPPTEGGLDSVVAFIQNDSLMQAQRDSLFDRDYPSGYVFNLDSLAYSPRPPHNRFEYTLNDTVNPNIYLLKDPDSDDQIGSLERTTLLNAPNWK